jgi:hypothetical protein
MATTTGLVQKLTVDPPSGLCCVWIGASPTNTTVLFVIRKTADTVQVGQLKTAMVDGIISAHVARREVSATHASTDSEITSLGIGP